MTYIKSIGIDLGTSYVCAAVFRKNSVQVIESMSGRKQLNYICISESSKIIGKLAKTKLRTNFKQSLFDTKLLMGISSNDMKKLKTYTLTWPFEIENDGERIFIRQNDKTYAPEEVTAMFLHHVIELGNNFLKENIQQGVITVPANFGDSQRQATLDAASLAGLQQVRLLNDTTAAAIEFSRQKNIDYSKNILFFNLGSEYLNLSIASIEKNIVKMKASTSHPGMGGNRMDYNIFLFLIAELEKQNPKARDFINGNKKVIQIFKKS